ncbi:MAG: ABC transporter substrate-binding protein [Halobacteriales archaeon]
MTDRRQFLRQAAAIGAVGLAGCSGLAASGETDDPTETADGTDPSAEGPTTPTATTSPTPDHPDEVVIGSNHPLTGSLAWTGKRLHQAVKLAATIKNENGGIQSMNGAEVTVIKGDNKGDPSLGAEVAQELVDDGAQILTGCYSSPVTNAATRVAESTGTPFVIDISVAAKILQETPLEYVYRAQPNSFAQASDHIKNIQAVAGSDLSIETAGLFYIDTTYGQSIRDGLRRAVGDTDIEIVEEATIGFGGTADTQVTKFRQADPDILIPTVFTSQLLELVSAMQDQDYWPPLFAGCATAGWNQPTFEKMGSVINGSIATEYAIDPTSQRAAAVRQRFRETYDAPMDPNVGMAFATAQVMIEAFEQAGTTNKETLNAALGKITVSDHIMAMPPIEFTKNGENKNPLSVLRQAQNLIPKIIYPDRYAQAEPKSFDGN